jgi:hypothetical protein
MSYDEKLIINKIWLEHSFVKCFLSMHCQNTHSGLHRSLMSEPKTECFHHLHCTTDSMVAEVYKL